MNLVDTLKYHMGEDNIDEDFERKFPDALKFIIIISRGTYVDQHRAILIMWGSEQSRGGADWPTSTLVAKWRGVCKWENAMFIAAPLAIWF